MEKEANGRYVKVFWEEAAKWQLKGIYGQRGSRPSVAEIRNLKNWLYAEKKCLRRNDGEECFFF